MRWVNPLRANRLRLQLYKSPPQLSPPVPLGGGRIQRQQFISGQSRSDITEWDGSPWACWNSPRRPASINALGSSDPGDEDAAVKRRRALFSVLLDAAIRICDLLRVIATEVGHAGLSAGSMVFDDPASGEGKFVTWKPPPAGMKTLGLVDFTIFPHLDYPTFPQRNSMAHAEKWAARMQLPSYAIDDQTAIQVVDGTVEVISEGHWKQFTHPPQMNTSVNEKKKKKKKASTEAKWGQMPWPRLSW